MIIRRLIYGAAALAILISLALGNRKAQVSEKPQEGSDGYIEPEGSDGYIEPWWWPISTEGVHEQMCQDDFEWCTKRCIQRHADDIYDDEVRQWELRRCIRECGEALEACLAE